MRFAGCALALALLLSACSAQETSVDPERTATSAHRPPVSDPHTPTPEARSMGREYPWHTGIVATTFWVGEIFDPRAADGSQVESAYDSSWMRHYGGCDGRVVRHGRRSTCETQRRTAANGWFPTDMRPRENPFYVDVPFDDINDPIAFRQRCRVVPWAQDPDYRGHCGDRDFSYLKNRWVRIVGPAGRTCFGQVEDAGPGQYHDAAYVFGSDDARPANRRYGGAGMDVSPALNGCLGFAALNGDADRISWSFVEAVDVPPGPWTRIATRRGPSQ